MFNKQDAFILLDTSEIHKSNHKGPKTHFFFKRIILFLNYYYLCHKDSSERGEPKIKSRTEGCTNKTSSFTMKNIFKLLAVILLILGTQNINAQRYARNTDVVHLKNGSILKGIILEQIPGVTLKLQTSDGNIFVYSFDEISRITRENRPTTQYSSYRKKNPVLAGICSFIIPGLGQFINGDNRKGFTFLGGFYGTTVLGTTFTAIGAATYASSNGESGSTWSVIGGTFYIASLTCGIWSICDAVKSAKNYNAAYGFAIMNIDKDKTIYLNPDIQMRNDMTHSDLALNPSVGMKLTLNF